MFRLTLKFGLHRVSRTDQRRKSRTPCIRIMKILCLCQKVHFAKFFPEVNLNSLKLIVPIFFFGQVEISSGK